MPFFGGGGAGDYKIVGTNIKGGNLAAPAIIGDNNMALGNGSLQDSQNVDRTLSIGNNAANSLLTGNDNVIIGESAYSLSNLQGGGLNVIIGQNAANFDTSPRDGINTCVLLGAETMNGAPSFAEYDGAVCIGYSAWALESGISIGYLSSSPFEGAISIGSSAYSENLSIGFSAQSNGTGISLGSGAVSQNNSIVIGNNLNPGTSDSIVIGDSSQTSIEIGGIDFSSGPGGGSIEGIDAFKIVAISATSSFSFFGAGVTTVGSLSTVTLNNSSVFNKLPNISASSAAGAGSGCGIYSTQPTNVFPVSGSLSGGFKFNCIVSINDASGAVGDAGRNFFGVSENFGALPSLNPSGGFGGSNTFGIGSDTGDSTLSIIVYSSTTGLLEKTSLGPDFPVNAFGVPALWEIELLYEVNPIAVSYKVIRKTNTNEYISTGVTAPIDTPLVQARPYVWRNNGAVASAVRLYVNSCSLKLI